MDSTRRQFVAASLSAVPVLAFARGSSGRQTATVTPGDPVWAQIEDDLKRLEDEIAGKRPGRETLRAFEATLRFHAAHSVSQRNDRKVQDALMRQLRGRGRAAFLADIAEAGHRHDRRPRHPEWQNRALGSDLQPTADELGGVADRLQRGQYAAALRQAADAIKALANQVAAEPGPGARLIALQWSGPGCYEYVQLVQAMEWLRDTVCILAMINPAIIPECAALAFEVTLMEMLEWWFCSDMR